MDIQSKKARYNIGFKITAWAVCIAGICAAAWAALGLYKNGWAEGSYLSSSEYKNIMQNSLDDIYRSYYTDQSRLQDAIHSQTFSLEYEREEKISSLASGAEDNAAVIDAINQLYDQKIEEAKNKAIQEFFDEQARRKAMLASRDDILYMAQEDGGKIFTNVLNGDPLSYLKGLTTFTQEAYYDNYSGTQAADRTITAASEAAAEVPSSAPDTQPAPTEAAIAVPTSAPDAKQSVSAVQNSYDWAAGTAVTVSVAMPQAVFEQLQSDYQARSQISRLNMYWLIGGLFAFAAGFAWLMYTAGRKPEGGEVQVGWSDAIPLDVGFLLMLGTLAASVALQVVPSDIDPNSYFSVIYICAMAAMAVSAWNLWFISLAKRIKRGDAGRYTACYMLFAGIHKLYRQSGVSAKAVWLVVLWMLCGLAIAGTFVGGFYIDSGAAAIVGFILMLAFAGLLFRFLFKKAAAVRQISQGLKRIQEGDMDYVIAPAGGPELETIADGINHIADGFHSAVKKEVRAERMKTELITNISHDLKTPLTSIIAYIDLLKKEELPGDNISKYVEVLDLKAKRLQTLTEDLFEAAKAASGDITVNMSKIELVQFMQQVLGEMSDKIEKSGLIFINDIPEDKMYVCADGRLLWRVMGNVLDNVLKYALMGSRVYIDVKKTFKSVLITVKNISRDPLNIPEEELMERFRRGDASRHTEGSGLGLSIAKDLMQIMGCGFEIEIDGDLFKVNMRLNET